ncbi:hypothetical protein GCM10011505_34320 [Tistrella bauzanensis]|uniref:Uncharacterized protein n=1 Tax=Tistrella bauzanensis TaxID=657419 RepID=A0ABQ1IT04_9PROT|nr:hypothetical protein [Tistrella bauzanensis]GGB50381.1 hypothetical protein GCM10011505_34320 [Tistrella bauzanensis]
MTTQTLTNPAPECAADPRTIIRPIGVNRPPLRRPGPMPVDFDVVTDPVPV